MAFFIFLNNLDNIEGSFYKISENLSDLNNLNINQPDYKIIEDSQENFNAVKYRNKFPLKYSNNTITYANNPHNFFETNDELKYYIDGLKKQINQFVVNNNNHPLLNIWQNYYNQLNNLNLETITFPLNKSLEQYFNDLGQPSYNILQLP
jgi:hypothetical protein